MTKTDAGSVDTNTVGGSCMYGENICRCCLKEKSIARGPCRAISISLHLQCPVHQPDALLLVSDDSMCGQYPAMQSIEDGMPCMLVGLLHN